jgi:hypothetical protein
VLLLVFHHKNYDCEPVPTAKQPGSIYDFAQGNFQYFLSKKSQIWIPKLHISAIRDQFLDHCASKDAGMKRAEQETEPPLQDTHWMLGAV